MAKLVVLFAVLQMAVAVHDIGEYTQRLSQQLRKPDFHVEDLRYLKEAVEHILEEVPTHDDVSLELKNKFRELLMALQRGADDPHRLADDLEAVEKIFADAHDRGVLVKEARTYREALKLTCGVLPLTFENSRRQLELALHDVVENLRTVSHDGTPALVKLLRNYVGELEMFGDTFREHVECLRRNEEEPARCLERLLDIVKEGRADDYACARVLLSTRVLEFNTYMMCHPKDVFEETPLSFKVQIQTVANGLTNAINVIDVENREAGRILDDVVREFVSGVQGIAGELQMRHIDNRLSAVVTDFKRTDLETTKTMLVNAVQRSVVEIDKILRNKPGVEVYGIISDFLAVLQRQTMQVQNIFQSVVNKIPVQKLAEQVQTITNGVLLYLRNVPTNDVMIREKLEVQVHHLVSKLLSALSRSGLDGDVALKIKTVATDFESFMAKTHITSIPEVVYHFDIFVQEVASGMKRLSVGSNPEKARNLLAEYLVIIENIQVKIQRINQVAQVGESPKELALQIRVLSEHLRKLLVVYISEHPLSKKMMTWQLRCMNQVLEVIADQLQSKGIEAENIRNLSRELIDTSETDAYQFRAVIGKILHEVSLELSKLTRTSHSRLQEGQGAQTTFVRSVLMEFLLALQDFHIQVQHNFQIVLSGQSPMKILREITTLTDKILGEVDVADKAVMAVQLGEYLQTIENVLNLLHHRMKNNGEHQVEQEKIAVALGKMSFDLQNYDQIRVKLETTMRRFVSVMQELVESNMEKVKEMDVGTHTGILHGALSNMLGTMRNMYVQMHHVRRLPRHDLIGQIASVGNNIMPALETIVGSTTPVKQALDLQVFKYARELTRISKQLPSDADPTVKVNIQEALMVLEQTASSIATLTINELKLHLNKLVQGVGNEIQKVEECDVLVEYLVLLKNLHTQIQRISRMSHQSENYQLVGMLIDSAVDELNKVLKTIPLADETITQAVVLEAHQMAQLIANVINRYQAASIAQKNHLFVEIASDLKTAQLSLQEMKAETSNELVARVQKSADLIEQLMWTPFATTVGGQYKPDMPTFVRVTLHDFLTAVQNMVIQIESVVVRVHDDKFGLIEHLAHPYDDFKSNIDMLDRRGVKTCAKRLLVLVEEAMEIAPIDPIIGTFVKRIRQVYATLKRVIMDRVFMSHSQLKAGLLEGVRGLTLAYQDLAHGLTNKHLLGLVNTWMDEFRGVLLNKNHDEGFGTLNLIKQVTQKIVNVLPGRDETTTVRRYVRKLHDLAMYIPDSIAGSLKNVKPRRDFASILEDVVEKLETILVHHDDGQTVLTQKLLAPYLDYLREILQHMQ